MNLEAKVGEPRRPSWKNHGGPEKHREAQSLVGRDHLLRDPPCLSGYIPAAPPVASSVASSHE